jgi:hypothetical protein
VREEEEEEGKQDKEMKGGERRLDVVQSDSEHRKRKQET